MEPGANVDLYDIDTLLSKEEITVREMVRAFVDQECMPVIAGHFDKATFPQPLIPRMAELGLFGLHVDGYGCNRNNHI
ncbi:MAG: acyl-CoA dehydrogenase family protein, partial [Desulfobacterales bacterium]